MEIRRSWLICAAEGDRDDPPSKLAEEDASNVLIARGPNQLVV